MVNPNEPLLQYLLVYMGRALNMLWYHSQKFRTSSKKTSQKILFRFLSFIYKYSEHIDCIVNVRLNTCMHISSYRLFCVFICGTTIITTWDFDSFLQYQLLNIISYIFSHLVVIYFIYGTKFFIACMNTYTEYYFYDMQP